MVFRLDSGDLEEVTESYRVNETKLGITVLFRRGVDSLAPGLARLRLTLP